MSRKRIIVIVGLAISVLALWFALRDKDWAKIVAAFQQADYRWLLPAALLILADYLFRAWRWGVILAPAAGRRLPLGTLFPVLLLGFAANNVLPARAGELWRMWGLARRTELRKSVALSTLVVERLFDGFTLIFFLALAGQIRPLDGRAALIEQGSLLLFGLVLIGLLLLLFFEEWTLKVATRLMWPVPAALRERVLGMIGRFTEGLHVLRRPGALGSVVASSLLAWGSQALSFVAILLAFDLPLSLPVLLVGAILMLALVNLAIMIPAGPGNVGTFEAGGILALVIAGIAAQGDGLAVAIVVVTHMLQWVVVTGVGLLVAAHQGITLAGLSAGPELEG